MSESAAAHDVASAEELPERLREVVQRELSGSGTIEALLRLSGGASAESWSFDTEIRGETTGLILRRAATPTRTAHSVSKEAEAAVQRRAWEAGVPSPEVLYVLEPADGLGEGYLMERVEGEALAPKILREERFQGALSKMARQVGEILAGIHSLDPASLPVLREAPPQVQLEYYRDSYDDCGDPHPVFDWAFRWLEERTPQDEILKLVHGDFRHGNFMVDENGIAAVLDWELAHLGDPLEDLGWVCVPTWRYRQLDKPVGGFGAREEMYERYEEVTGVALDRDRARYWEIFGSLKWGIICMQQGFAHLRGSYRSVEKAVIGRRASEADIDLLRLILGKDD